MQLHERPRLLAVLGVQQDLHSVIQALQSIGFLTKADGGATQNDDGSVSYLYKLTRNGVSVFLLCSQKGDQLDLAIDPEKGVLFLERNPFKKNDRRELARAALNGIIDRFA